MALKWTDVLLHGCLFRLQVAEIRREVFGEGIGVFEWGVVGGGVREFYFSLLILDCRKFKMQAQVVTAQPGVQTTFVIQQGQQMRDWNSGLFSCFDEFGSCKYHVVQIKH